VTFAQDDLMPTGKEGLKKRSWVLLDTSITVRGERTIDVQPELYEGKSINYVAFYVKDRLIGIDEIPPFSITHDFGNYTQKAEVVAIGVKYLVEERVAESTTETTSAQTADSQVQSVTTTATSQATSIDVGQYDGSVTLLSPTAEVYAFGLQQLIAEVNIPVDRILRVDFNVNDRLVGSVETPPYEMEYDFGRGFEASRVAVVVVMRSGGEVRDEVVTRPLEESDYYLRTRLVTLEATVIDWRDRLVGDLKADEFRVFEDGIEQKVSHFSVEERPIRVALLLDASGSMRHRGRMMMAVQSAKQFLDFLKPQQDKAALVIFTDRVTVASRFTNEFKRLKDILDQVEAEGGTAINDALDAVSGLFEDETGRKAIVLITDGYDEHSNVSISDAVEKVRRAGVKIFSIGIFEHDYFTEQMYEQTKEQRPHRGKVPDVDPTDARKKNRPFTKGQDTRTLVFEGLSDETGGASFFPKTLNELPQAFTRIADELRHMYSIGYAPTNTDLDGRWRKITVNTTRGGLTIRAKRGYYAEK
jgi:VWFA-related protein